MRATRDITFDIMKGVLIILVVIGHAIQVVYRSTDMNVWLNPIFNFIYTFHMPLFIFISGLFYKKSLITSFIDILIKKSKRLILPVIVYTSILIFIYAICYSEEEFTIKFVYKQCTYYWFLICLFVLMLLYWLFYKVTKPIKALMIILYISMIALYDSIPSILLKDCQLIRQTMIFGIATYFGLSRLNILTTHKFYFISVGTFIISLIRYYFGFDMMDYPIYIRIIDQLACSMVMFELLYFLILMIKKSTKITNPLLYLGQNSLGIYLIHMMFPRIMLYAHNTVHCSVYNVLFLMFIWLTASVVIIELLKRIAKSYSFILGV